MRSSLTGKRALITGSGSGIGRALAVEASSRGMAVALVGRRAERLEETREFLVPGADCLILPGDVTSGDVRRDLRDRVTREWGALHFLVNNAGIVAAGPLAEMDDPALERVMATNVVAPIALVREMLPLLRTSAPARVVNIGSMFGDIAFPLFAPYSASKFALRGLSAALRRELKALGVGVTYASPRGARTDATEAIADFVEPFGVTFDRTDVIARHIWDAVAKGRTSAYPRGPERFFTLIERLFPALIDRAVARQLAAGGGHALIEEAVYGASAPPEGRAVPVTSRN